MLYMKDLFIKSQTDLTHLVDDLKAQLFTLHFKNSTGQQNQTHKIKLIRRDIARVLMTISIKEKKEGKKIISKDTKTIKKSYSLKNIMPLNKKAKTVSDSINVDNKENKNVKEDIIVSTKEAKLPLKVKKTTTNVKSNLKVESPDVPKDIKAKKTTTNVKSNLKVESPDVPKDIKAKKTIEKDK